MALLGSKKKGDAAAPAATEAAPARATVVKERKARPAKAAVKNGTITGLNIGNASIKAVEVTAKNGQLSVSRIASVPTPPDAFQNGNVLSVSALSNAIKALWKAGGFKGKAVISSVAGTGALVVRVIEVPTMSDSQLADAMRADAQLYIPFPPTEVQMDFKALRELPTDPDAGTMDVLLAAAQSEIIDLHIKTLQGARLDPRAVDVEPIAAGRTLTLLKRAEAGGAPPDYNEISAIANIGAFGTEISLLRGDVLVFTRSISAGGNSISQIIADTLGVPLSEGERLKIEQGNALPPEGYGAGAAGGDDFGFGNDFGAQTPEFGGEFDDFGLNTASSPPSNATTVLDAPASTSSDPFDLDFFNQGPKDEPGAGHGQKEGEPPANSFSFDDDSLIPEPARPNTPPGEPASAGTSAPKAPVFSFDFDLPEQDLPSQDVSAAATPSAASAPVTFAGTTSTPATRETTLPDDFIPVIEASASSQTMASPQTTASSLSMPSAFDFSDFDLPAATSAPDTSSSAPVATSFGSSPSTSSDLFAFGDEPDLLPGSAGAGTSVPVVAPIVVEPTTIEAPAFASPSEAMSFEQAPSLSFGSPDATAPATTPIAAPSDGGFDLDAVFGSEAPAPVAATSQELHVADEAPQNAPVADGMGVEGLELGSDNFDFGGQSGDIGDFGAGLSGAVDADGAALYGALAQGIEELSDEISRSLSFYLERVPDAALSRIYLTGGGALMRNLDVYLTGRLGAPTSVLNPLQLLPGNAAVASQAAVGPIYTVALGLALRDFVD